MNSDVKKRYISFKRNMYRALGIFICASNLQDFTFVASTPGLFSIVIYYIKKAFIAHRRKMTISCYLRYPNSQDFTRVAQSTPGLFSIVICYIKKVFNAHRRNMTTSCYLRYPNSQLAIRGLLFCPGILRYEVN